MTWIQTYTGKKFDLLDPQPDMIDLQDIIVPLSRIPRFNAHTKKTFTVGQHSLMVSSSLTTEIKQRNLPPRETHLWGLLHDAPEAYIGDIVGPLKDELGAIKPIERRIRDAILTRFSVILTDAIVDIVKEADVYMCYLEARSLLNNQALVDEWSLPFPTGFTPSEYIAFVSPSNQVNVFPPSFVKREFQSALNAYRRL